MPYDDATIILSTVFEKITIAKTAHIQLILVIFSHNIKNKVKQAAG
jgi:hypothetical protein